MRLSDVIIVIEQMSFVKKVISDGKFRDEPRFGPRHLFNVPYVEIVESSSLTGHSTDGRMRDSLAECRLIGLKERDDSNAFALELENLAIKREQDQLNTLRAELDELELQTVMVGKNPIAIISGVVVKVGQSIGSFKVVKINKRAVIMKNAKYRFALEMQK